MLVVIFVLLVLVQTLAISLSSFPRRDDYILLLFFLVVSLHVKLTRPSLHRFSLTTNTVSVIASVLIVVARARWRIGVGGIAVENDVVFTP